MRALLLLLIAYDHVVRTKCWCVRSIRITRLKLQTTTDLLRGHRLGDQRQCIHSIRRCRSQCWAKGGGSNKAATGFGSRPIDKKSIKVKAGAGAISKKSALKRVQDRYGGTSAEDVARGTQAEIERAMKALPPHLQMATQLYQNIQKWNSHIATLSVLQQASVPQHQLEGAKRAQDELTRLYKEHNFTENDLHNIFQTVTWDASAVAKSSRSITGDMPSGISTRVQKACGIIAEAVVAAGECGRCLDVGCGFGVLVPFLLRAGLKPSQIVGVDLSSEMIRNARDFHPDIRFQQADFFKYDSDSEDPGFDGIIFCSSLHDMPNPMEAILKASSLLRPNGKIVLAHPQGASHVVKQLLSNPIMVKRGLPDAVELDDFGERHGLKVLLRPAKSNSLEESSEGYLAVLQRI